MSTRAYPPGRPSGRRSRRVESMAVLLSNIPRVPRLTRRWFENWRSFANAKFGPQVRTRFMQPDSGRHTRPSSLRRVCCERARGRCTRADGVPHGVESLTCRVVCAVCMSLSCRAPLRIFTRHQNIKIQIEMASRPRGQHHLTVVALPAGVAVGTRSRARKAAAPIDGHQLPGSRSEF